MIVDQNGFTKPHRPTLNNRLIHSVHSPKFGSGRSLRSRFYHCQTSVIQKRCPTYYSIFKHFVFDRYVDLVIIYPSNKKYYEIQF